MNSVEPRISDWMCPVVSPWMTNTRKRTHQKAPASAVRIAATRNTRSGS